MSRLPPAPLHAARDDQKPRKAAERAARASLLTFGLLMSLLWMAGFPLSARGEGRPQAQLFITRPPDSAERARRTTRAKYEPDTGCYLGAYIDFDGTLKNRIKDQNGTVHHDPLEFERIVGRPHAMYFFYLGYGKPLPMDWVKRLAAMGKFVHIALEPNGGLKKVNDDAYLQKLADDMARSGARIFLRFASEMNGDWVVYSRSPAQYRHKFRLVSRVMRQRAPNVAMVWCPYTFPRWNLASYYPGDDATDWVGVNLYNVTYHNNDINAPAAFEHPADLVQQVYRLYAGRKPMMICEYAATHYSQVEGQPNPEFAMRKILTLYAALPRLFPRIKCINYFNGNAMQYAAERATNDYSVTNDPLVLAAYRYATSSPYFLDQVASSSGTPLREAAHSLQPTALGAPPSRPSAVTPIPLPIRKGELLRGKVRLSCWARAPSDILSVTYKVDGHVIYKASRPDLWECIWDAGSVPPGQHTLSLVVRNGGGKIVAQQTIAVQTTP